MEDVDERMLYDMDAVSEYGPQLRVRVGASDLRPRLEQLLGCIAVGGLRRVFGADRHQRTGGIAARRDHPNSGTPFLHSHALHPLLHCLVLCVGFVGDDVLGCSRIDWRGVYLHSHAVVVQHLLLRALFDILRVGRSPLAGHDDGLGIGTRYWPRFPLFVGGQFATFGIWGCSGYLFSRVVVFLPIPTLETIMEIDQGEQTTLRIDR